MQNAIRRLIALPSSNHFFADVQVFTCSLKDVAQYRGSSVEFMRHWDDILFGKLLCVNDEKTVADSK
jgi:hypothetical protein